LDIRESLINNLGNELIVFSPNEAGATQTAKSALAQSAVYAVSVRDAPAMRSAIKRLLELFAPGVELFDSKTFQGELVYTPKPELGSGMGLSYAITDEYLLVSIPHVEPLQDAITRIKGRAQGLWFSPKLEEAYRMLPQRAQEYSYVNLKSYVMTLLEALAFIQQMGQSEQAFCNPEALPKDLNLPYYVVSAMRVTEDSARSEAIVLEEQKDSQ